MDAFHAFITFGDMKIQEKPIRWFKVFDAEEFYEIISARTHSRAKIEAFCNLTGAMTASEALITCKASVIKPELDVVPKHEGETYPDGIELLEKGVFSSVWTYEPCKNCGAICGEENGQRIDRETKKFYCSCCKK